MRLFLVMAVAAGVGTVGIPLAHATSCTQSVTADTPRKTSAGTVVGSAWFDNGSGCGTVIVTVSLHKAGCCGGWSTVRVSSFTVYPGTLNYQSLQYPCSGTSSHKYQSYGSFGTIGGTTSSWVSLPCG
jgi:hypothetical protein